MPCGDGTGPCWGRGYGCGIGLRGGFGRGFWRGFGPGRRAGFNYANQPQPTAEQEIAGLKDYSSALEAELTEIKKRLQELEKKE